MSTQDKKIKVVSTADFDNNKIINATIDASENEVIGVGKIDDVLVNGESVVENKIANVEVPEIDSQLSDVSENAVQNKVIDAALKAMKPVIVTDSGTTLPLASGYQLNDTFLNTTDKKLYTLNSFSEYSLNTSQFASLGIYGNIFDNTTGNFSNFNTEYNGSLYVTPNDTTNFVLTIPFQVNNLGDTMGIVQFNYQGPTDLFNIRISSTGSVEIKNGNNYLEVYSSIQVNEKYILKVEVSGEEESSLRNISVKLYDENGTMLGNEATSSYDSNSVSITMGVFHKYGPNYNYFIGTIFGFLETQSLNINNINLVAKEYTWGNGTALTDKTEYADKTNGILYLYGNTELVKIGGSLTKKVYTISADNTSTLDVSSDFTKVVDVLKNGVELALTDDYTISSGVITFVTALSTTDKITVKGE